MKHLFLIVFLPLLIACNTENSSVKENVEIIETKQDLSMNDELLRHVVLIKFNEMATPEDISQVEEAFGSLQDKIPEIKGYEWGINNSPEGINKGFTHCFLVTFESEEDREIYLPHPDHKAFVDVLSPHMEDVLVVDYWAK
ncbi:MAG: Dabb family protein [Anditalea sp.]